MIIEVSKIKYVYELLTPRIRGAIMSVPEIERDRIQEIRLRRGRRLSVTIFSKEYFVNDNGRLMNNIGDSVQVTTEDIETIYQRAFQNSLHSFHREIARGYITVSGGCRVGFCGTAVLDPARSYAVESVKNISSLNIRIAREMIGSSDEIYAKCFSDKPMSLLIASPPSGGKTTVLRDLARKLGERWRVALIDERNEFAATVAGEPQNLIGAMTDVFNSYNKYEGIMTAVKVMSPLMFVLKIISDIATPVSLACRLFGNMIGGMIVMDLLKSALGGYGFAIPSVAGLWFNLFHPLIQTYIFIVLSLTFIKEAAE